MGWGLIPACAGKTCFTGIIYCKWWAHPRVCGENGTSSPACFKHQGSSPRVRGKLEVIRLKIIPRGLIPACAGKTDNLFKRAI